MKADANILIDDIALLPEPNPFGSILFENIHVTLPSIARLYCESKLLYRTMPPLQYGGIQMLCERLYRIKYIITGIAKKQLMSLIWNHRYHATVKSGLMLPAFR